jgi:hypothetical protein
MKKTKKTKNKILKKKSSKKQLITGKTPLMAVVRINPEAGMILFEAGLHCIGCGGAAFETLEQGCIMHGMSKANIKKLLIKLNKMKKVYLIHGWGGDSQQGWFNPLKKILEKEGIKVLAKDMPDTFNPKIDNWINKLKSDIKQPDEETYFIGHSIGCQTIMRYLEKLPENIKIGGCVFVAGWFHLTDETWDEEYTKEIAEPWINTSINFDKIKSHTKRFLLIASEDDPYVPLSDSKLFKQKLGAEIMIEKNQGHIEELNEREINKILNFLK